jgi:hypothetical protein
MVFMCVVVMGVAYQVAVVGCHHYAVCIMVIAFALHMVSLSPFVRTIVIDQNTGANA